MFKRLDQDNRFVPSTCKEIIHANVSPDFATWAKGFSGCNGGNLHGAIWACGIEWGTGKDHEISRELRDNVSNPPQIYRSLEDIIRYPYGIKLIKLITAMGLPGRYTNQFPFHPKSQFFQLNLFPIAFKSVNDKNVNDGL